MVVPFNKSGLMVWAEIDMAALRHNFMQLKKKTLKSEIIPVIKANAYGHGAIEFCKFLSTKLEVNNFGVARVSEGVHIRQAGIKNASLIVLGGFFKGETADIIKYSLEPSVFSKNELQYLNSKAQLAGKIIPVHLKINTGMNRLGIKPEEAQTFIKFITTLKNISLRSVYTHFACADTANDTFTSKQVKRFSAVKAAAPAGIFFHAANSAAIAKYNFALFDAVRPGIALYGSFADKKMNKLLKLKPVMTLKSRVINTLILERGEGVSYAGLYKATQKESVAVVSIGYGDGFRRELSNKWHVMINGKKAPVIGRVCMDLIVVKPTGKVKIGDEVLIFGKDNKNKIAVEDMASAAGTISYEILTGITDRVKRVYKY
ncbi:MAG: alanine racemase [bacterium]